MDPGSEIATVRVVEDFDASGDAATLRASMKGMGTDEEPIIAVICNRANEQRQIISEEYTQAYGRHLLEDLKSELGGHFEDVIEALMKPLPEFLADEVHHAIDDLGTDEKTLVEILCTSSNDQLAKIAEAYEKKHEKPLPEAIEGDTSGDFKRLLVAMIAGGRDEGRWGDHELAVELAEKLYDAAEGKLGTNEEEFTRIMVQYSYPQLRLTFRESEKLSGKPFNEMIDDEFTGSMQKGLLAIYYSTVNRPAFFAQKLNDALGGMGTSDRDLIRALVSRSEIDLGNVRDEYEAMFERSLVDHIDSDTHGKYKRALMAVITEP